MNMSKGCIIGLTVLAVIVVVILIAAGFLFGQYNRIVTLDENANAAWANVETVLQRRFDLIPNLVNTVKGYASHEKELLEEVTRLRSQWGKAQTVSQKAQAASLLEGALGRLMVVVENYPDLKANQNFLALQDELAGTENRISVERRRYNEAVRAYNTRIRRIPTVFIANLFGFDRKTPFEADEGAQQAPKVSFE
jgi:LemA protein